jgi:hypothetical protein
MNKLNDMISAAAKLATQTPRAGETLEWNASALARAISDWYGTVVPRDGPCLLIDVADEGVALRGEGDDPTTLICTGRALPERGRVPETWQVSQRVPSDLQNSDAALLERARSASSVLSLQQAVFETAQSAPWIADKSTQTVVAPFLLNVAPDPVRGMSLAETSRVLTVGGSFETLVVAADEPLSEARIDCHGQACRVFPQEHEISGILLAAGFHGVTLRSLLDRPFMIVNGVELSVFALTAHVGTKGVCLEQGDAAIYLGPWSEVRDDDGHAYPRGVRIAVCAKTAGVLQRPPYAGNFKIVQAYERPPLEEAALFDCSRDVIRPVAETKGRVPIGTSAAIPGACTDAGCDC